MVEENSYLEVRDCLVKSVDLMNLSKKSINKAMRKEHVDEMEDTCFKIKSFKQANLLRDYSSLLNLISTTVSNFYCGINAAEDSVIIAESSSFVGIRQGDFAIRCTSPKVFRFSHGSFQKSESGGIIIELLKNHSQSLHKITIEHNRFVQLLGTPVLIKGPIQSELQPF